MASTIGPLLSQTSWPVFISVATATKRIGRFSMRCWPSPASSRAELVAAHQPAAAERYVDQVEHAAPRQLQREIFDLVEPARGIAAADHGADRGADDHVGDDAHLVQFSQRANMRPAARDAGAERQPDARPAFAGGAAGDLLGYAFAKQSQRHDAVLSACAGAVDGAGVRVTAHIKRIFFGSGSDGNDNAII